MCSIRRRARRLLTGTHTVRPTGRRQGEEPHDSEEGRSAPCGRRCTRSRSRVGRRRPGRRRQEAAADDRRQTPPTTPTNLRATNLSQTSVTLAWDPSTDNSGTVTYSVYKDGQGFTVPQGQTTYTIDWLSPGRTYTFYVTATDPSLNQSGPSNTVTVTTLADTTATLGPELSGSVRGPSQVSLTWTRSTDDTTWWSLGYRIFANGVPVTQHVNWYAETQRRPPAPRAGDVLHVHRSGERLQRQHDDEQRGHADDRGDERRDPALGADQRAHRPQQGCGEFFVGWTQSTDDTDPQYLIEYEIYVNGVLSPLPVSSRGRRGLRLRHGARRRTRSP